LKCVYFAFKSIKKLNSGILGLQNKPTIPESCRFPLSNPHKGPIVDFVPDENIREDLEGLYIRQCILKYFIRKMWNADLPLLNRLLKIIILSLNLSRNSGLVLLKLLIKFPGLEFSIITNGNKIFPNIQAKVAF